MGDNSTAHENGSGPTEGQAEAQRRLGVSAPDARAVILVLTVLRHPEAAPLEGRRTSEGNFRIGRGAGCDWVLSDPERLVSRQHCVLEFRDGSWQVRDLSANGTFLNRAAEPIGAGRVAPLRDGDRLRLGRYEFEVRTARHGVPEALPPPADPLAPSPPPRIFDDPFGDPFGDDTLLARPPPPNHAPTASDAFKPPQPTRAPLPEDWGQDLVPDGTSPAREPSTSDTGGLLRDKLLHGTGRDTSPGGRPGPRAAPPENGGGDPLPRPSAEPSPATDPPRLGSILWNPPARMKVGTRERIEVRLGDARVAIAQLHAGLRGRGAREIDELEVAPSMRVALMADPADFSLLPLGTADQHVRPGQVARWDFDAPPLRGGRRRLRVLVSMRVKFEGKDEVVDLPSYEREVQVAVAPIRAAGRFCGKNWQWIAGSVDRRVRRCPGGSLGRDRDRASRVGEQVPAGAFAVGGCGRRTTVFRRRRDAIRSGCDGRCRSVVLISDGRSAQFRGHRAEQEDRRQVGEQRLQGRSELVLGRSGDAFPGELSLQRGAEAGNRLGQRSVCLHAAVSPKSFIQRVMLRVGVVRSQAGEPPGRRRPLPNA